MKIISKALLEAQKEMGNALKDSKNPFFKSSYADLNSIREACLPPLNKHGIVVLQPTAFIDGKNFIKTILLHESGESMESLTEIVYSKQNDAQSQGSGITYARRYGLQSFVNVGAEDDDGNSSSKQNAPWVKTPAVTRPDEALLTASNDLKACKSITELAIVYKMLTPEYQKLTLSLKDELKAKLK
jgi:hypothetical protein